MVFRRGTPPDALYTFKHALVQDAAYDSLLKSKRMQVHAQIAEVWKNNFTEQVTNAPEIVAYHYSRANMPAEAMDYWLRAAKRAASRSAYREALAHLDSGTQVVEYCSAWPPPASAPMRNCSFSFNVLRLYWRPKACLQPIPVGRSSQPAS